MHNTHWICCIPPTLQHTFPCSGQLYRHFPHNVNVYLNAHTTSIGLWHHIFLSNKLTDDTPHLSLSSPGSAPHPRSNTPMYCWTSLIVWLMPKALPPPIWAHIGSVSLQPTKHFWHFPSFDYATWAYDTHATNDQPKALLKSSTPPNFHHYTNATADSPEKITYGCPADTTKTELYRINRHQLYFFWSVTE